MLSILCKLVIVEEKLLPLPQPVINSCRCTNSLLKMARHVVSDLADRNEREYSIFQVLDGSATLLETRPCEIRLS